MRDEILGWIEEDRSPARRVSFDPRAARSHNPPGDTTEGDSHISRRNFYGRAARRFWIIAPQPLDAKMSFLIISIEDSGRHLVADACHIDVFWG